jgi:hypothetical protein
MKQTDLNDAEWRSLQELRKGPIRHKISPEHAHKLLILGYAKYMFAGLMVTDTGRRAHRAPASGGNTARPLLTLVPTHH